MQCVMEGERMLSRGKVFIAGMVLSVYVLGNAGCAAAWFLAGAGTAATVVAVSNANEKENARAKEENVK